MYNDKDQQAFRKLTKEMNLDFSYRSDGDHSTYVAYDSKFYREAKVISEIRERERQLCSEPQTTKDFNEDPYQQIKSLIYQANSKLAEQIALIEAKHSKEVAEVKEAVKNTFNKIFCKFVPVAFIKETHNFYHGPTENAESYANPAYVIYCEMGEFLVHWRRSVIHLEWSGSLIALGAEELFPKENTTKDFWMIHAHGYNKFEEYLNVLHQTYLANKSK